MTSRLISILGLTAEDAAILAFGSRLRAALDSPASYALLASGTWQSGGCWPLARAVAELLGEDGQLLMVVGGTGESRGPQHVVVSVGGWCIDAEGAVRSDELLRRMADHEWVRDPALAPIDAASCRQAGLYEGRSIDRQLAALLRSGLTNESKEEKEERVQQNFSPPDTSGAIGRPTSMVARWAKLSASSPARRARAR